MPVGYSEPRAPLILCNHWNYLSWSRRARGRDSCKFSNCQTLYRPHLKHNEIDSGYEETLSLSTLVKFQQRYQMRPRGILMPARAELERLAAARRHRGIKASETK